MESAIKIYTQCKQGIEKLLAAGTHSDGSTLSADEIAEWKRRLALFEKCIEMLRSYGGDKTK
jgi:hypothetical protein